MDLGWATSQAVIGMVVVVPVIGCLAFFLLVEPRRGDPSGGAASGPHGRDAGGAGAPAGSADGADTRGDLGAASVFETEPCWVSLVNRKSEPATTERDAAAGG